MVFSYTVDAIKQSDMFPFDITGPAAWIPKFYKWYHYDDFAVGDFSF